MRSQRILRGSDQVGNFPARLLWSQEWRTLISIQLGLFLAQLCFTGNLRIESRFCLSFGSWFNLIIKSGGVFKKSWRDPKCVQIPNVVYACHDVYNCINSSLIYNTILQCWWLTVILIWNHFLENCDNDFVTTYCVFNTTFDVDSIVWSDTEAFQLSRLMVPIVNRWSNFDHFAPFQLL